jgi:hypothetical protein
MPIRNTVTTGLLFLSCQYLFACAGVAPGGDTLAFGDQEDLIIYNSKTQTEYFVRNAKFDSVSRDFGFIAPTPTKPELSSVKPELLKLILGYGGMSRSIAVQIVDEVKVAGYKATIIKATDQKAMSQWLKSNNYTTGKSVDQWLDFYIKKGWYFTAFKVDNITEVAETGVICMKFKTKIPFHPFYVPEENEDGSNTGSLKVAIVSDYPALIGQLGDTAPPKQRKSYGYVSPLVEEHRQKVADLINCNIKDLPEKAFVKVLPETPFPTQAKDDIYFFPVEKEPFLSQLFVPEL